VAGLVPTGFRFFNLRRLASSNDGVSTALGLGCLILSSCLGKVRLIRRALTNDSVHPFFPCFVWCTLAGCLRTDG
jgi:hypothetical protein